MFTVLPGEEAKKEARKHDGGAGRSGLVSELELPSQQSAFPAQSLSFRLQPPEGLYPPLRGLRFIGWVVFFFIGTDLTVWGGGGGQLSSFLKFLSGRFACRSDFGDGGATVPAGHRREPAAAIDGGLRGSGGGGGVVAEQHHLERQREEGR